eukprot:380536_1
MKSLLLISTCLVLPTSSTSNNPTTSPSNNPTASHSNNPTASPSYNPTTSPSNDATSSPSNATQSNLCVRSCVGLPTGDYQSCQGCQVYASCVYGVMWDNIPCPSTTYWDNNLKICVYSSDTCSSKKMTMNIPCNSPPPCIIIKDQIKKALEADKCVEINSIGLNNNTINIEISKDLKNC